MKSRLTNLLYIVVPIVFLLGIVIEFILGYLPGTQWYPVLTSWPLILLVFLFITFSIKERKLLDSSAVEKNGAEAFWKQWAGILWIFWSFYIVLAYFIPDPTDYLVELPDLVRNITIIEFIITLSLGLFVQFSSHRNFWRFFAFCIFTLQGVMFLLDNWSF